MELNTNIRKLSGVGDKLAKKFEKLGITKVEHLIKHYPRKYLDFTQITPINLLKPGDVVIKGKIKQAKTKRTRRRGFTVTEALFDDGKGTVKAVWFNQPYLAKSLPKGVDLLAAGRVEHSFSQMSLQNPLVEKAANGNKLLPVYPETEGLTSRQIRKLMKQVVSVMNNIPETLPKDLLKSEKLLNLQDALREIHFPGDSKLLASARKRLGFEELFELVLTSLVIKGETKAESTPRIKFIEEVAKKFASSLPYTLTDGQRKAAWQILKDLDSTKPMNRLLEGDVASGKTVVAAMAAALVMANGFQVALMAPTEILANQHFSNLQSLLNKNHIEILTSSIKGNSRKEVLEKLKQKKPRIVIGTHALLTDNIKFKKLGLVIIDEQHRFGVNQRAQLKAKAGHLPHLLSMSATPIPRSLALTVYGDLDISVIDELPQGRKYITTRVASDTQRHAVYAHIDKQIAQGRQVYVICPLISESDKLGVKSVENESARLNNDVFKHRKIGVLHGRMKPAEKTAIMTQFKNGAVDILVSTTVVEVGVDVPNASVMLIEGAERFGLAQLHQLRGRVGRATHQSYCYVIASSESAALERLKLLEKNNNGFVLAQKDLELRGPGTLYGTAQHGLLDLRMADITDFKYIAKVREAAVKWLAKNDISKYPHLSGRVNQLKTLTTLD